MGEFISVMFRAITGLTLSLETMIVLGVFFVLGWLFGKLTRRIGVLKVIALIFFGSMVVTLLSVMPGVVILAFVAGVLMNHGPLLVRMVFWAYDLADIYYALRYQQAFEDIRQAEADIEEEMRRARAEAYRRAHAQGDSAQQARWRGASGSTSGAGASGAKGGSDTRGAGSAGQKEKQKADQGHRGARDRTRSHGAGGGSGQQRRATPPPSETSRDLQLQTLGLAPGRDYTPEELKKAHRRAAKKHHPDAGGSNEAMTAVNLAYEALLKHAKRQGG